MRSSVFDTNENVLSCELDAFDYDDEALGYDTAPITWRSPESVPATLRTAQLIDHIVMLRETLQRVLDTPDVDMSLRENIEDALGVTDYIQAYENV